MPHTSFLGDSRYLKHVKLSSIATIDISVCGCDCHFVKIVNIIILYLLSIMRIISQAKVPYCVIKSVDIKKVIIEFNCQKLPNNLFF